MMKGNIDPVEKTPFKRSFPPLVVAMLAQLMAAVGVLGLAWGWMVVLGDTPPLMAPLLIQGGLAALLGSRFGLAAWWLPIQFVLPSAVVVGLSLPVPPWVFLAAFLGLLLVYWNSAGERVPLYLTNRTAWAALDGILPEKTDLTFIDLGSGLGGVIGYLAERRPQGRFDGVESAPAPFLLSWLRLKLFGLSNVDPAYGDMWKTDLSSYDAVYCFLSPAPMAELHEKVRREMRPGSLFISNSFEVPGYPADQVIKVDDRRKTKFHIWRL